MVMIVVILMMIERRFGMMMLMMKMTIHCTKNFEYASRAIPQYRTILGRRTKGTTQKKRKVSLSECIELKMLMFLCCDADYNATGLMMVMVYRYTCKDYIYNTGNRRVHQHKIFLQGLCSHAQHTGRSSASSSPSSSLSSSSEFCF